LTGQSIEGSWASVRFQGWTKPSEGRFHATFGPRGVLDCRATDRDDPTEVPRFGVWGKQSCKDTGALNSKRMETLEDDLLAHSVAFMQLEDPALFATFSSWR